MLLRAIGWERRNLEPRTERRLAADDFHWEHGPPVADTQGGACLLGRNGCLMHSEEGVSSLPKMF